MPRKSQREHILDAAEEIVLRDGPGRLTMDAVAAEAEVSKGGFLYHFASKQALLEAMVARLAARFEEAQTAAGADEPEAPGREARAYLRGTFPSGKQAARREDRLGAALLAALAHEPALLEPLRARYLDWQRRLETDGLDPALATVVRLAVDGLWLADLFGLAPLRGQKRKAVLAALEDLTRRSS